MKYLFTIILVTSFIGIAVFGVFGMHGNGMQGHDDMASSNCIAATAKGMDCPKETEPINFFNFHLDAFRSFSTATFGANLLASLLVLTLLFIGVVLSTLLDNLAHPQLNLAYSRYEPEQFSSPHKQQLLRWLALHENSPASP